MPSAPHEPSISAARAGALFASPLQRCDEPAVRQARHLRTEEDKHDHFAVMTGPEGNEFCIN